MPVFTGSSRGHGYIFLLWMRLGERSAISRRRHLRAMRGVNSGLAESYLASACCFHDMRHISIIWWN